MIALNEDLIADIFGIDMFLKDENVNVSYDEEGERFIIDDEHNKHTFDYTYDDYGDISSIQEYEWHEGLDDDGNIDYTLFQWFVYKFKYDGDNYSIKKVITDSLSSLENNLEAGSVQIIKEASFDIAGNVLSICEYDGYGKEIHMVEFDGQGNKKVERLTKRNYEPYSVDDGIPGSDSFMTEYTYDEKGNIVDKKEYKFEGADLIEKIEYLEDSKKITTYEWGWEGPETTVKTEPLEKIVHTPEEIAEGITPTEKQIEEIIEESVDSPTKDEQNKTFDTE